MSGGQEKGTYSWGIWAFTLLLISGIQILTSNDGSTTRFLTNCQSLAEYTLLLNPSSAAIAAQLIDKRAAPWNYAAATDNRDKLYKLIQAA